MAIFLFADNASSTLAANIGPSSTTITLAPGDGALFPSPAAGQQFTLTLNDAATHLQFETAYCTHRAGDVLTVVRGQEGTTAQSWLIGDQAFNGPTSGTMLAMLQTQHVTDGSLNPVFNNLTVNGTETVGGLLTAHAITSSTTVAATTAITAGTSITAAGAIAGAAINSSGTIAAATAITGGSLAVTGGVSGNAINSTGTINATGAITGASLSVSGGVNGAAINSSGTIAASGDLFGVSVHASGTVSGAAINSSGTLAAAGNITSTGGNIATGSGGSISAGSGGVSSSGSITTPGQVIAGNGFVASGGDVSVPAGSVSAAGAISAVGNMSCASFSATGTVRPAGGILVGTTSNPVLTGVNGFQTIADGTTQIYANVFGEYSLSIGTGSTSGPLISFFWNGPTAVGSINTNGSSTTYNTTSDYRLKRVDGAADTGSIIDTVPVHKGAFLALPDESRTMFLAHELAEAVPYAVRGEKDAVDENSNPVMQQVDHSALVPILWAEIKALRARVAALEHS